MWFKLRSQLQLNAIMTHNMAVNLFSKGHNGSNYRVVCNIDSKRCSGTNCVINQTTK